MCNKLISVINGLLNIPPQCNCIAHIYSLIINLDCDVINKSFRSATGWWTFLGERSRWQTWDPKTRDGSFGDVPKPTQRCHWSLPRTTAYCPALSCQQVTTIN